MLQCCEIKLKPGEKKINKLKRLVNVHFSLETYMPGLSKKTLILWTICIELEGYRENLDFGGTKITILGDCRSE